MEGKPDRVHNTEFMVIAKDVSVSFDFLLGQGWCAETRALEKNRDVTKSWRKVSRAKESSANKYALGGQGLLSGTEIGLSQPRKASFDTIRRLYGVQDRTNRARFQIERFLNEPDERWLCHICSESCSPNSSLEMDKEESTHDNRPASEQDLHKVAGCCYTSHPYHTNLFLVIAPQGSLASWTLSTPISPRIQRRFRLLYSAKSVPEVSDPWYAMTNNRWDRT